MALIASNGTRLDPAQLVLVTLGASTTFTIGDLVESMTTGVALPADAASASLGVIVGLADASGAPLRSPDVTRSTVAYSGTVDSVLTDGTNSTGIMAQVCFDQSVKWSAEVNGTIGTTNDSQLRGCGIDIDSANSNVGRVLETTATRTAATITNFYSHGVDPSDATRLLVSISCSEVFSSARG